MSPIQRIHDCSVQKHISLGVLTLERPVLKRADVHVNLLSLSEAKG